jgi:hypothetical protein
MKRQGVLTGWILGLGATAVLVLTVSYGYSREPGSRLRQITSAPVSDIHLNVKRGSRGSAILGTSSSEAANAGRTRYD